MIYQEELISKYMHKKFLMLCISQIDYANAMLYGTTKKV